MPDGYSRSPLLIKGALVEFSERFLGPVPNVIIFQYNPESFTRTLEVWDPGRGEEKANPEVPGKAASTAQPGDPPETFNLTLELDATDDLEVGDPVAVLTGVADRIAALEMLTYPVGESLLGGLMSSISGSLGVSGGGLSTSSSAAATQVPRGTVPVVLFVWGPGRIVPVRLTSFSVEEQAFSPTLYPTRAKVTVGLKVLTDKDLESMPTTSQWSKEMAITAYKFTRKQKEVLAAANLANSVESILNMLPI